jgi:deoxyribodipyrimidine photo-lyase
MMPLLSLDEIYELIDRFDPIHYGKTRNYQNGGVSRLSPYLSRGVISTRQIFERLRKRGFSLDQMDAFVMELCWRDHAQRIWQFHNPQLELRTSQFYVQNEAQLPQEMLSANTGFHAIDQALLELKNTGYMHNHLRMYLAALVCNHYGCHWRTAAKWLFAQLCDADAASNHLSWQWVCGANAPKVYYANQENINKYTGSTQKGSSLDTSYEQLPTLQIPCTWTNPSYDFIPDLSLAPSLDPKLPTFIYTPYHLDPEWRANETANKILFWDLDNWQDYPFSQKVFTWINDLAQKNLSGLQIVIGTWTDFKAHILLEQTFSKEHPLVNHYGICLDPRDWLLSNYTQQPGSFFNFWKKVRKHLQHEN